MATKEVKPEFVDLELAYEFHYPGYIQNVPKDQVKNKTEAQEIAEREYKKFKRQPKQKPIEE